MKTQHEFLALPGEIRNFIYQHVFATNLVETELANAEPPNKALSLCCRQMYKEAHLTYCHAFREYWQNTHFFIWQGGERTFNHLRNRDIEHITSLELRASWTPPTCYIVSPRDLSNLLSVSLKYPQTTTAFTAKRDKTRRLWFCAYDIDMTKPCTFPTLYGDWELGVAVMESEAEDDETTEALELRGVMRPLGPTCFPHILSDVALPAKVRVNQAPPSTRELEAIVKLGESKACDW